jgi:hypothetical protein
MGDIETQLRWIVKKYWMSRLLCVLPGWFLEQEIATRNTNPMNHGCMIHPSGLKSKANKEYRIPMQVTCFSKSELCQKEGYSGDQR